VDLISKDFLWYASPKEDRMAKKYIVALPPEERAELLGLLKRGTLSARKLNRIHILLLADEGHTDEAIAASLHTGLATVARIRQRWVAGGRDGALHERPRPGRVPRLDERANAHLVARACTPPPEGRSTWTMQLLADELVVLEVVDAPVSDETVRRALKKTISSRG
jgi:transposase